MKTKKEFEDIVVDFRDALNGTAGDAFTYAVLSFMKKHKFEQNVMICLHDSFAGATLFFTDHYMNDIGFVFVDLKCGLSAIYVGSKTETKRMLQQC